MFDWQFEKVWIVEVVVVIGEGVMYCFGLQVYEFCVVEGWQLIVVFEDVQDYCQCDVV